MAGGGHMAGGHMAGENTDCVIMGGEQSKLGSTS